MRKMRTEKKSKFLLQAEAFWNNVNHPKVKYNHPLLRGESDE